MGGISCHSRPSSAVSQTRDVIQIYGNGPAAVKSRGGIKSMHNLNFRFARHIGIL
jgi:hypothetical protein